MSCVYCNNDFDFTLPSGTTVCGECFNAFHCRLCWQDTNVVGATSLYNDMMLCVTCINNTPPMDDIYDYDPIINIIPNNYVPIVNNIYYEIDDTDEEMDDDIPLMEPPAGFDMNTASSVEENPDYMDNLINAQIEYEGRWYFALDGQIYSTPYEIEIDDYFVRQDIVLHWDDVRWDGSIFGNYIAWY